jgi:hypothetical protein
MTMGGRWSTRLSDLWSTPTILVPYRYRDDGWFDYMPMQTALPMALWHATGLDSDRAPLDDLELGSSYAWTQVHAFRDKEEAGHEEPWFTYLDGRNPSYPEEMLETAIALSADRTRYLEEVATGDVGDVFDLWQQQNPVLTEALVQLTCGAPQVLYNGGLMQARLRYFDAQRLRPGLPADVAALVDSIEPERTAVTLVNTSTHESRCVIVQAGAFGEHEIVSVQTSGQDINIGGSRLQVDLEPHATIRLQLRLRLRAHTPTSTLPF